MPLGYEDQKFLREEILKPMQDSLSEKIGELKTKIERHDGRLILVEQGQADENREIKSINVKLDEGNKKFESMDARLSVVERFKLKMAGVAAVIGIIVGIIYGWAKQKIGEWMGKH